MAARRVEVLPTFSLISEYFVLVRHSPLGRHKVVEVTTLLLMMDPTAAGPSLGWTVGDVG
jgi:hypothetical protein